ncbi:MAG: XdhC/CoxI family protein [Oxalobacteraceae bacterium]|nr:MAG: XdhC/CoxI family protein [Oxalobacteraceae bacterium]
MTARADHDFVEPGMMLAERSPMPASRLLFHRPEAASESALTFCRGNARLALAAACVALEQGNKAVLAIVLETLGSAYAAAGTLALYTSDAKQGWLSGGCWEPEISRRVGEASSLNRIGWMEIDTREDESLLSGSATGCRGRSRLVLLPLHVLPGCSTFLGTWLAGHCSLQLGLNADGSVEMATGQVKQGWIVDSGPLDWPGEQTDWHHSLDRPPEVLVLGCGPEAPHLASLLHGLGWQIRFAERRSGWRSNLSNLFEIAEDSAAGALSRRYLPDAALVMHHNFELDWQALDAIATLPVPFVGLLGPRRRREDLFKLLSVHQRESLLPRLRSPIGLNLGGSGPEAIALSIAAQLESWRNSLLGS